MEQPLCPEEVEILGHVEFSKRTSARKATKEKNYSFVFTYKKGFGPAIATNQSSWTAAKKWLPGPFGCGPRRTGL